MKREKIEILERKLEKLTSILLTKNKFLNWQNTKGDFILICDLVDPHLNNILNCIRNNKFSQPVPKETVLNLVEEWEFRNGEMPPGDKLDLFINNEPSESEEVDEAYLLENCEDF